MKTTIPGGEHMEHLHIILFVGLFALAMIGAFSDSRKV